MSALIKNMDIPSSCMRCRLLVHDEFENYYSCPASNKSFEFDEDIKKYEECKPEWCPLEEGVPIVHGHWIYNCYYEQEWYKCSNCDANSPCSTGGWAIRTNYCPHCGAKMYGESENNNNE